MKTRLAFLIMSAVFASAFCCRPGYAASDVQPNDGETLVMIKTAVDLLMLDKGYAIRPPQAGGGYKLNYYFREVRGNSQRESLSFDLFTQKVAGISIVLSEGISAREIFDGKKWKIEYFGQVMPFGKIYDLADYEDPGSPDTDSSPKKERDPSVYWSEVRKLNLVREGKDLKILGQFEWKHNYGPPYDGRPDDVYWFSCHYDALILEGGSLVNVGFNAVMNSYNDVFGVPGITESPLDQQLFYGELLEIIEQVRKALHSGA
ncbi:MAG: hypothetical protein Q7I97_09240 [Thermovirgaceae bacterium]|nr:hypothetical protein [Thermovirgaceae bacterium]